MSLSSIHFSYNQICFMKIGDQSHVYHVIILFCNYKILTVSGSRERKFV